MNELQKEAYAQQVRFMAEDLGFWTLRHPTLVPRFQLPPKGVMLIAPLSQVPTLCQNDEARSAVAFVLARSLSRDGAAAEPTVFMFDVALQAVGLEVERVALSALGLKVGAA